MKARIPKKLDTIDSNDGGKKVVKATPDINMEITPKKSNKKTKGLSYTPKVSVQQNMIMLTVEEIFKEELEERGTDKRSEILFEMTKREFIDTFNPESIKKYAKLAVSNILKDEIKCYIQLLIQQRSISSELNERKILEELFNKLDNLIEEYFKVEVSEDEIKELQEYIKRMKEYARKEIEKRIINAIEMEETEEIEVQEEITDTNAQIKEPLIEPEEKQKIIRNAMQEVETEVLMENVMALNEGNSQDTQSEEQYENDSDVEESDEKEEEIKPSYFEEVMSFTDGFSFFCKDSMIYAAETGFRKKFHDLVNYMKFYELRSQVQRIMDIYGIRESRAMKKILEDSKKLLESGVLDQEDLEVLEAAENSISAIEYKQQMEKKEEGR